MIGSSQTEFPVLSSQTLISVQKFRKYCPSKFLLWNLLEGELQNKMARDIDIKLEGENFNYIFTHKTNK